MPKGNRESASAPQEVVGKTEVKSKVIERGTTDDVAEDSEAKAIRLFAALEADLKRRKKEAKDAGKDPKEVRGFDKKSELYGEYILAFNENQMDALEHKADKFQKIIDSAEKNKERVSDEIIKKWRENLLKISEVTHAKRARQELSDKIDRSEEQISDIQEKVEVLGKEDIAMTEEIVNLEGEVNVAKFQRDAVERVVVGEGIEISTSVPVAIGALEVLDNSDLEEIIENQSEVEFFKNEEPSQATEIGRDKRGVKMLNSFFAVQLAEDKKANLNFRGRALTRAFEEFVADDEDFARLLLKNDVFVKSVEKLFDVGALHMYGLGNKMLGRAAEFASTLGQLRNSYDSIKAAMAKPEYGMPELPEEVVEKPFTPVVETKVNPEASEQEVKSAFLSVFIFLRQSIDARKKDLAAQQSDLKAVKFFDFKKKAEINSEINYNKKEVGTLFNRLIDLGNQIRDRREILKNQPDKNFDKIKLYSILIDQIDTLTTDVKTKKEKPGSVGFFDKYSKAIALGSLLFAVGSEGGRVAQKPDQKTASVRLDTLDTDGSKLQSVMPKVDRDMGGMSEATVNKFGQTLSHDISVEPKAESWGGSSAEPTVETGYTPAETIVGPIAGTEETPSDKVYKVKQAKKINLSGEFARKVQNVEDAKPVVEAVVEPKKEEKIEQAPEVRHERKLDLEEVGVEIEKIHKEYNLTQDELDLVNLLYRASRTGGEKSDKFVTAADKSLILLNRNVVGGKRFGVYESLLGSIKAATNYDKRMEKKNGNDGFVDVSKKIEIFQNTENFLPIELTLVDLLYRASKTGGEKGKDLLVQAEGYFIALDSNAVGAERIDTYKGFIEAIKNSKGI